MRGFCAKMEPMDGLENRPQAVGGAPSAPPPPQEVKVRTMASDLASMAASGGGLPQFQNVKMSTTPAQKVPAEPGKNNNLLVVIVVAIAVVVLVALGYVVVTRKNTTQAPATTGGQ